MCAQRFSRVLPLRPPLHLMPVPEWETSGFQGRSSLLLNSNPHLWICHWELPLWNKHMDILQCWFIKRKTKIYGYNLMNVPMFWSAAVFSVLARPSGGPWKNMSVTRGVEKTLTTGNRYIPPEFLMSEDIYIYIYMYIGPWHSKGLNITVNHQHTVINMLELRNPLFSWLKGDSHIYNWTALKWSSTITFSSYPTK